MMSDPEWNHQLNLGDHETHNWLDVTTTLKSWENSFATLDIKEPQRTHASQSVSDDKTLQKSNLGLMEKIDLQKESMSGGQVWVTV